MITIYWAGDSTVKHNSAATYPQTGIGQAFSRYLNPLQTRVENHAENGRSTRSFMDEGRLAEIEKRIKPGDFLFIQFGHNDEKSADPARYTDPDTTFRENLARFAEAARSRGALPVFITPVTRFHLGEATEDYRHTRWTAAMKAAGDQLGVPVIDLTAMSEQLVLQTGEAARTTFYMNLPEGVYPHFPKGQRDNTHLQPAGALAFAGLIARALKGMEEPYASLLCAGYDQWQAETEHFGIADSADAEVER